MYTLQDSLQDSEDFTQSATPMISDNGFIRFEGVRKQLPISNFFEIYRTQTLVAKRQANERTKGNNILRMEQILRHYGIDPAMQTYPHLLVKRERGFRSAMIG
jgi:hypothetical protein